MMTRLLVVLTCVLAFVAFGCGSCGLRNETGNTTPIDNRTEADSESPGQTPDMGGGELVAEPPAHMDEGPTESDESPADMDEGEDMNDDEYMDEEDYE
jgi:hypothetical protein